MWNKIAAIALGLVLGGGAAAQRPPAPLTVSQAAPGVYWVEGGSGANTGILIGSSEVVVIDAKMTGESARAVLAEIAKLTPQKVTRVVLTHSDGDHVNGLPDYPAKVRVVAHANAAKDMKEAGVARAVDETVAGSRPLELAGLRVELLYFGPAHTDGDLVVWLPDRKVAFVGDLIFIGRDPLIHLHKRGTSLGVVGTLKKLLELDADTYISGHAPPAGKAEIRTLLASIEEKQARVKKLIAEGRSLDEVKAVFGVAGEAQRRPGLIEVIYRDLSPR